MSAANCNNRLVRCPFCGCLPRVRKEYCEYMRDDYYVVACESIRCVVNARTHPRYVKDEPRMARKHTVAAWNQSILSNADDRNAKKDG